MTSKTFSSRSGRWRALAIAVLAAAADAQAADPITTQVSGHPSDAATSAATQSETAYNISVFPAEKKRIETVAYNDWTGEFPAFGTNNASGFTALVGRASLGWSFRVRTPTDPNPLWTHAKIRPPAGTTASALWGDPGIASHPTLPNVVFISTLAIPTTKFPASGFVDDNNRVIDAVDDLGNTIAGAECRPLGGACVMRSTNGGIDFSFVNCFVDTTTPPGGDPCRNTIYPTTLGHFYDGSSMAVVPNADSTFSAFAAFNDTEIGGEAIWKTPNVAAEPAIPFTLDRTALGSMGALDAAGTLGAEHLHVRLRADGQRLWKMGIMSTGQAAGGILANLKVNIHDRTDANGGAVVVATNAASGFTVAFPQGTTTNIIRTGPQYAFDIGVNETGQPEMRFVYVVLDATGFHLQGGLCTTDLSLCGPVPGWALPGTPAPMQFHPAIKFGHDPETNQNRWLVTFHTIEGTQTRIRSVELVRPDLVPNTPSLGPDGLVIGPGSDLQTPCPDTPVNTNGDRVAGYWGDYDDMAFDSCSGTFSRSFSDSTRGCVFQHGFDSNHAHVSSVELPGTAASNVQVTITGTVHIVDQENVGSNQIDTWPFNHTCTVSTATPTDTHIRQRDCTGDEVDVRTSINCTLQADGTVRIDTNAKLLEGTDCTPPPSELADEDNAAVFLATGQSKAINIDLVHDCFNCGDHAEIRLTAAIQQRACLTP